MLVASGVKKKLIIRLISLSCYKCIRDASSRELMPTQLEETLRKDNIFHVHHT